MTRKRYFKKMYGLNRRIAQWAEENKGERIYKNIYKQGIPNFGTKIGYGSHKGEILRSYQQCWDMFKETLGTNEYYADLFR